MLSHIKCIFCKTELYFKEIIIFLEVSESSLGNTDSKKNTLLVRSVRPYLTVTKVKEMSYSSLVQRIHAPVLFCKSFLVWVTPQPFLKVKQQMRSNWTGDPKTTEEKWGCCIWTTIPARNQSPSESWTQNVQVNKSKWNNFIWHC